MLTTKSSSAIIAVTDTDRARHFYKDVLGLDLIDDGMGGVMVFRTGATQLVVYPSEFAGTNKANAAVFDAGDDLETIVADLESKGVAFERYPNIEGMVLDGNIHRAGKMALVWIKDPDGNILHLNRM